MVALLERILKTDLPRHGGRATSLVVLIDHDTLVADLTAAGIAQTTTGEKITAGQARRLACQASPPTGRDCWPTSRVRAAEHQRAWPRRPPTIATSARDVRPTRRPSSAALPARSAHGSRPKPRAADMVSRRAQPALLNQRSATHDPGWNVNYHPNGTTTFTRRQ